MFHPAKNPLHLEARLSGAPLSSLGRTRGRRQGRIRVLVLFTGRVALNIVYRKAWFNLADSLVEQVHAVISAARKNAAEKNFRNTLSWKGMVRGILGVFEPKGGTLAMLGEEKKSRKSEKVGINMLVGKILDGLKSLTEIGLLDDISGILSTLARNKDYIVALVEKSYSFSMETNKVWVEHKDDIERMFTQGDRLLSAFSADSETLAKSVGSIASGMASVAGGLSTVVNEAKAFLPEARKTLTGAGPLVSEVSGAIPVVKEFAERSLVTVNEVNEILPALKSTARDAAAVMKELSRMLPQMKELLNGANVLLQESQGLVPKAHRVVDALNRSLPKLDKLDAKVIKKFFQEDGFRIFLKKLPF